MSITATIHTLYWENSDPDIVNSHRNVINHFNLPVEYHTKTIRHGLWMQEVLDNETSDIVGFVDIDCIPLRQDTFTETIRICAAHRSICGIAQATNHIPPMTHVFCGPGYFFIWRKLYEALGRPPLMETQRSDVCEEICYQAEAKGIRYHTFFPTHFEREPVEGVWRLHNLALYGVGTTYGDKVYHLFQGRMKENAQLFAKRCKQVVDGTFNTNGMFSSTDLLGFRGKVSCFQPEIEMKKKVVNLL
ncbi:hypothetical protein EBR43_01885 [bacterium]|nr:hypothetical protein [bacterium]